MFVDGINFIETEYGIKCPVFYSSGKRNSNVLWILFSAGGPRRKSKEIYPLFDRISWVQNYFSCPCLIFEDPSYFYNKGIQDGWYLGNHIKPYHAMIAEIIEKFKRQQSLKNQNLRFFGSSTGGTAAIWVHENFPGSICIASNPQIDISLWPSYSHTCEILKNHHIELNWQINVQNALTNSQNQILISMNTASHLDNQQTQKMLNYLDLDKELLNVKRGVFKKNNKFIWLYNIETKIDNPHNALPLFGNLLPMENLFFKNYSDDMIQTNFMSYEQLMRDYYMLNDRYINIQLAQSSK